VLRIVKIIVVAMLLPVISFAGVEQYLRTRYTSENRSDIDINRMILYSNVIVRTPNSTLSFRFVGLDGTLLESADIKLNNKGFFSENDYSDAPKEKDEFRIVVLGGEQTASSVVSKSWPDMLQERLSERNKDKKIRVFNLAWPDAGPFHYMRYWKEEGVKYDADLVIINMVESDFNTSRSIASPPLTSGGKLVSGGRSLAYRVGQGADDVAEVSTPIIEGTEPKSFRDPGAVPSRPYGFFASQKFMNSPEKIRALQSVVVEDMIAGVLPPWGMMTLNLLRGKVLPKVSVIRNFDSSPPQPVDREAMVEDGVTNFSWFVDNIPNLLLVHNFHYGELKADWPFTAEVSRRNPRIQVVDMRSRIPAGTTEETLKSWYMIPHMGEKWNSKGHEAFAGMMADLVEEWRNSHPKAGSVPGEPAPTEGAAPSPNGE
jgi:hypothetical protein